MPHRGQSATLPGRHEALWHRRGEHVRTVPRARLSRVPTRLQRPDVPLSRVVQIAPRRGACEADLPPAHHVWWRRGREPRLATTSLRRSPPRPAGAVPGLELRLGDRVHGRAGRPAPPVPQADRDRRRVRGAVAGALPAHHVNRQLPSSMVRPRQCVFQGDHGPQAGDERHVHHSGCAAYTSTLTIPRTRSHDCDSPCPPMRAHHSPCSSWEKTTPSFWACGKLL